MNRMDIEKRLEQLQQVPKADAPPYLLTRIRAKIRATQPDTLPRAWQWAGALGLVVLLLLNFGLPRTASRTESNNIAAQYGLYQTQQLYVDEN
jgi:hypothetical protein